MAANPANIPNRHRAGGVQALTKKEPFKNKVGLQQRHRAARLICSSSRPLSRCQSVTSATVWSGNVRGLWTASSCGPTCIRFKAKLEACGACKCPALSLCACVYTWLRVCVRNLSLRGSTRLSNQRLVCATYTFERGKNCCSAVQIKYNGVPRFFYFRLYREFFLKINAKR